MANNNSKELLLISLGKFYSGQNMMQKILPILNGTSETSLRLLDWFVTNYSKKFNTVITKVDAYTNNNIHFNVYLSYRSQLKAYSKQLFDPFRRRERIIFYYDKDTPLETTIGQLNFFKWILQNSILDYVKDNQKLIEKDMVSYQKTNVSTDKNDKKSKKDKKNKHECNHNHSNMNLYVGDRLISFS